MVAVSLGPARKADGGQVSLVRHCGGVSFSHTSQSAVQIEFHCIGDEANTTVRSCKIGAYRMVAGKSVIVLPVLEAVLVALTQRYSSGL